MDTIDKSSEEHRRETEAREVALMPVEKRIEFYDKVKQHRGQEAAEKLMADVLNIAWKR